MNKDIYHPCGKCIACRINERMEWSVRLVHEWKYWNDSCFVTLTYDDEHLPENCSCRIQDLQNFFHYLREDLRNENRSVKYFACSEYGDKGGIVQSGRYAGMMINRPHYHAIIFGLSPFDNHDRQLIIDNWQKCDPILMRKKLGIHGEWLDGQAIDFVTPDDISYVCGYVEKKVGAWKKDYLPYGLEAPNQVCSLGIGKKYCMENQKQILDLLGVQFKGKMLPIPRQYKKWLGVDNEALISPYKQDYVLRHPDKKPIKYAEIYDIKQLFQQAEEDVLKNCNELNDVMYRVTPEGDRKYSRLFHHYLSVRIQSLCEQNQTQLRSRG